MKLQHVILSDLHFPLHDDAAVRGVIDELRRTRIEHLHLLGDMYDCAAFSRFLKTPNELASTPQTLVQGKQYLSTLIARLNARKVYFYVGNHEQRLIKYILRNAPALFGTVTYNLLVPYGVELVEYRWGKTFATHFGVVRFLHGGLVRKNPGQTALEHLKHFQSENVVLGHSHRLAAVYDRHYFGVECGHLSQPDEHEYCATPPQWTKGFAFIDAIGVRIIKME